VGKYENGEQVGIWQVRYDNGQLESKGEFVNGKKAGIWKYWLRNGEGNGQLEW